MSTVDSALLFMVAFKSGSVTAFSLRENMHWTHLLGLRFRPFCPDHSEMCLRALLIMGTPWASLQGYILMPRLALALLEIVVAITNQSFFDSLPIHLSSLAVVFLGLPVGFLAPHELVSFRFFEIQ